MYISRVTKKMDRVALFVFDRMKILERLFAMF
jgi:hypothetical protein